MDESLGYTRYSRGRSASVSLPGAVGGGQGGAAGRRASQSALTSADRFIPTRRRASDIDVAYFRMASPLTSGSLGTPFSVDRGNLPAAGNQGRSQTGSRQLSEDRILIFTPDVNSDTDPVSNLRQHFESMSSAGGSPMSPKPPKRYIPSQPDHIYDMPELQDDFYSNVLAWSSRNIIAIALQENVYLWDAKNCGRQELPLLESLPQWMDSIPNILALAWDPTGCLLAIGTDNGLILLWDIKKKKMFHVCSAMMECPHYSGISSLAWNPQDKGLVKSLYCGQLCGCVCCYVIDHDGEVVKSARFGSGHSRAICGLALSRDGKMLATGGDSNSLKVWNTQQVTLRRTIKGHSAAIKAVAWCPWQSNILASGGGSGDGHIRVWNVTTGACMSEVDTESQVCALAWSSNLRELASGHGVQHNDVMLWQWPSLNLLSRLTRHNGRVLHLALSPSGHTLATAGADEQLMLWKCFETPTKPRCGSSTCQPMSPLALCMR